MKIQKVVNYLICLFLFLLPWQTRWIYKIGEINGGSWEHGTLSFYGTEILLWIIILLFAFWKFGNKKFWKEFHQKIKEPSKNSKLFLVFYFISLILLGLILFSSLNLDISLQWFLWWLGSLCLGVVVLLLRGVERSEMTKQSLNCHSEQSEESLSSVILRNRRIPYIFSLWLGGVLQGIIAFVQFFVQNIPANKWLGWAYHSAIDGGASVIEFSDGRFLRAYGSFGSPNSLGIYLGVCLVLGLILYLELSEKKLLSTSHSLLFISGQLLVLSGLVLSFSRSAWISCLIGLIVLFFIILKANIYKLKTVVKHFFYYFLLITLYLIILFPLFSARFNLDNRLESRSIIERSDQYSESLSLLKENFLFGTGFGNYTLALYEKYPNRNAWEYQPVHNIYLLSLVELGIFGFLIYWGLVLFLIKHIWKNDRVFLASILVMLIAGLFDHWLFSMYTGVVLFWIIISLSFLRRQESKVSTETSQ